MIINYDEGPYNNWTAVNFPAGETLKVALRTADGASFNKFLTFAFYDDEGNFVAGEWPERLQAIITGDDSGASLDCRLLPIPSTSYSFGAAVFPNCAYSISGDIYNVPSGTAVSSPNSGPWEGAFFGGPHLSGSYNTAFTNLQYHTHGSRLNADPACNVLQNANNLPAFIVGETCTISDGA